MSIKIEDAPIITRDKDKPMTHKPITYSIYDGHCGLTGCGCDHARCYKGWIDNTAGTWPCLYCRDNLTGRLMRAGQARDKGYPQAAISRILMDTKR